MMAGSRGRASAIALSVQAGGVNMKNALKNAPQNHRGLYSRSVTDSHVPNAGIRQKD